MYIMKKLVKTYLFVMLPFVAFSQFHTLKMPKTSPQVTETQQLGVTDITIDYHSPAVRGRKVWKDVVTSYDDPDLLWRAGANMNTRIQFSTDVMINGQVLPAGNYGFHVEIKDNEPWTLFFAHNDNLWGSYYLDKEKDIALRVDITPVECNFSEQLDYRFIDRTDSSLVVALEWAEKRIPFTVSVDLNKTVIESFRYELRGINTYRWEAWNDAANWCLRRNTNLEEALEWANRSINGGYGGFAANQNVNNTSTKAKILLKLGREEEFNMVLTELQELITGQNQVRDIYWFGKFLIAENKAAEAEKLYEVTL